MPHHRASTTRKEGGMRVGRHGGKSRRYGRRCKEYHHSHASASICCKVNVIKLKHLYTSGYTVT